MPQKDNPNTVVYKGLNAVKNAYDRSYQQAMIDRIDDLLPQKKYYKGYCYFSTKWFNFERVNNDNKLPYNLEILYRLKQGNPYPFVYEYEELFPLSVKSLITNMDTLFIKYMYVDYKNVGKTEIATLKETIYFEGDDNLNIFQLYNNAKDTILSNIYAFVKWEYVQAGNDRKLIYTFSSQEKALSQRYKIKIIQGTITAEGEVDEVNGLSNWGWRFRYNQPTWCNKFALDVTYNTYNKDAYILDINDGASAMRSKFEKEKGKYIELKDKTTIWTSYINKGYLVFFSDDGHIEVGFPDNKFHLHYRDRYEGDTRYPNDVWMTGGQTINLTIGAGGNVGYKPASRWAIKEKKEGTKDDKQVKSYIYLDYLRFEN
jgi:hypothetical protein